MSRLQPSQQDWKRELERPRPRMWGRRALKIRMPVIYQPTREWGPQPCTDRELKHV